MKKTKHTLLLFAAIIIAGLSNVMAQEKSPDQVKKLVESQSFIFKAEIAYPQGGSSRTLSPEYDVTIGNGKVVSVLPYFGQATSAAGLLTGDGGIKFTSTDFEYSQEQNSKGWSVTLKPKDAGDVREMLLTVFDNGTASLDVTNTNRQSISYSGYIK